MLFSEGVVWSLVVMPFGVSIGSCMVGWTPMADFEPILVVMVERFSGSREKFKTAAPDWLKKSAHIAVSVA